MKETKKASMCTGKTRHTTKEGACVQATKSKNVLMNVYLCSFCKGWHVGKTRNRTRGAQRIEQLLERDKREQQARIKKLQSH